MSGLFLWPDLLLLCDSETRHRSVVSQLFQELKRRNVFRVGLAYLAVAWLVL